jgi:hypothetical protein
MSRFVAVAFLFAFAAAQSPGNGISKSTYSCDDPIPGWQFLMKYFPVATAPDECANNVCDCPAVGSAPAWQIQQGRVYTTSSADANPDPGMGFGMHLVNVSAHLQTGGMTTAQVEAQFVSKLGDMSAYDSFMDFNIGHYTSDLDSYTKTFTADGVKFLPTTFTANGTNYHTAIVHVPGTQMILELISDQKSPEIATHENLHHFKESRISQFQIDRIATFGSDAMSVLKPMTVNRAASADIWEMLSTFYSAMKTKVTQDETNADMAKKCFLWSGAAVEVCFTKRADTATKGTFKVGDFEKMLNTVHKTMLKNPDCGNDKWEDNHYAIDNHNMAQGGADYIIEYIDATPGTLYFCEGAGIHYIFDPTGWGIQLDLQFTKGPAGCVGSGDDDELNDYNFRSSQSRRLQGGGNPACSLGNCTLPGF